MLRCSHHRIPCPYHISAGWVHFLFVWQSWVCLSVLQAQLVEVLLTGHILISINYYHPQSGWVRRGQENFKNRSKLSSQSSLQVISCLMGSDPTQTAKSWQKHLVNFDPFNPGVHKQTGPASNSLFFAIYTVWLWKPDGLLYTTQ